MLLPLINLFNRIFNTSITPYWVHIKDSIISSKLSQPYVIACKKYL